MYYRCLNHKCGFVGEGESVPTQCPSCGGVLEACEADTLSGADWTRMGIETLDAGENAQKAYACLQQAAIAGDLCGMNNLGWCLETGTGVECDKRQAVWI